MYEPLDFLKQYCDFSNPNNVWIIELLARRKDNPDIPRELFERYVIRNADDIEVGYNRFHDKAKTAGITYRIYVSLNARSTYTAAFKFQKTLVDITEGLANGNKDAIVRAGKIDSEWKSQLAQSNCRATKRILIDIDTNDSKSITLALAYLDTRGATIHARRKTPNGFHAVIEACDTRDFMEYCKSQNIPVDIQRDSLLFVESWTA